ncbi:MAG: 30S ribosomal protein S12 methylthiotransferase RimO [Bacteroidales bacterium]|nr:30S ribosomal protein S12 methylthiotransferase RimO [Bacteroidales bacterium]
MKTSDKKTLNIITLGCSKNVVDSEKLLLQAEAGGYSVINDPEKLSAGTTIINTCGFINDAKEESIDTILRLVKAREKGDIGKLFVIGCLSQRYKEELRKAIPEVDRYFGVNDAPSILEALGINFRKELALERKLTNEGHYAFLKASEGCDRKCSFCIIPSIRGKYISRPVEELFKEAEILHQKGVKELILIAQDLSYYGIDLYRKQMLPSLLRELLKIGFGWIRLHYLYPANFTEELLEIIRDNPSICKYIDIPVQHITDRMLTIMKRSHTRSVTESTLEKIRKGIPGAAIRTTLIVGHPGETEEDFIGLKEFVRRFRFERLGVFTYSHEEGTASYENYEDEIPPETKERRAAEIMELQQSIAAELNERMTGQVIEVLIDRREGNFFAGRTQFDSPEVDQEVLIPAEYNLKPGSFYRVLITHSENYDLFGKPV